MDDCDSILPQKVFLVRIFLLSTFNCIFLCYLNLGSPISNPVPLHDMDLYRSLVCPTMPARHPVTKWSCAMGR